MELRALVAVMEVGGVPEVVGAPGIAETTVETHLGWLNGKAGTRRQSRPHQDCRGIFHSARQVSPMREDEKLSGLIGDIYDAALNPSLWVDVLGKCAEFVGGPAASLYFKDATRRSDAVAYQFGLDPHYVRLYVDEYAKLEPTTTGYFFAEIEAPTATADVMLYREFLETRFYKEWARPQGLVDTVHVVLDRSATTAACFVVFRHQRNGVVDDETKRRMRLIIPHIRRAALIGKILDLKGAEAATMADTFDGIGAGMFLVDATGRIVHANAAGNLMLTRMDPLRTADGRLIANDPKTDQTFADIFLAARAGDAGFGVKGIGVPLTTREGQRFIAHILPLTSGARRRAATNYAAVAALFVHEAVLSKPSAPEVIAKAYNLAPTELRVLLAVIEIGGAREVAEALGIAETTVKTHLGRLYEKTGAGRHADLVKLVAGFCNPLVS
jgi:DNA-binding CsgD family transcriptional regulator